MTALHLQTDQLVEATSSSSEFVCSAGRDKDHKLTSLAGRQKRQAATARRRTRLQTALQAAAEGAVQQGPGELRQGGPRLLFLQTLSICLRGHLLGRPHVLNCRLAFCVRNSIWSRTQRATTYELYGPEA